MKKITLITGAGRGIGKEIAIKFGEENHILFLLIQKKQQKKELIKILSKKKIDYSILVGDLKDRNFVKSLDKKIPKVNNLINNAAVANTKYFTNVSRKELDNIMDVNLKSIFEISQIFSKKMIKKNIEGNIINISSQLGHTAAYNRSAYCMTKFGLEGLTKSMALDLAKYGIKVNSIAPTKTIVNLEELSKTKKRLNIIRNKIPLKKFSTVKEIAGIAYFLTTEAANSITGTSIISDGGWTAGK
ncbi:SDR family oxidoreductase [Candidatus Pelagibacter bacterium]|jgi:NAD(P)-dependent dehydrogenase (short-subunit alcohol dehydrogenase family)|nr:SDR family oxidoreductase [Candidatus Pelagibacter bacterium]|tara:strand:+ start:1218 stop:1949 length:732 start_codon:yes stop_codon:yes gene_type:complete